MSATLQALKQLAKLKFCACITYRKPGEEWVTERVVEPYSLSCSGRNLILLTWQLEPTVHEYPAWRHFRLDRIVTVKNAGRPFKPRVAVTLPDGEVEDFVFDEKPRAQKDTGDDQVYPEKEYFLHLQAALEDKTVTPGELAVACRLASRLKPQRMRAVHAQIYANLLGEAAMDGEITPQEEDYLQTVRMLLTEVGWCP